LLYSELKEELKRICNEFEAMYPITEGSDKEFDMLFNDLDNARINIDCYIKTQTERAETAYNDGVKVGYNRYLTAKEIHDLKNMND
jgi:hypothetical protein